MSQPIQNPVVGSLLQKAFNLQGRVRPTLEEFVVPVVSLGDLSTGAEPPVVRRASCGIIQAAVVGQSFTARFEVPGGVLAVIRSLRLYCDGTARRLRVFHAGNAASIAAPATGADHGYCDGRLLAGSGITQTPAGQCFFGTQAASLVTVNAQYPVSVDGLVYDDPGWVVGTGAGGVFGFLELQI